MKNIYYWATFFLFVFSIVSCSQAIISTDDTDIWQKTINTEEWIINTGRVRSDESSFTLSLKEDTDYELWETITLVFDMVNIPQDSGLVLSLLRNEKDLDNGYYYGPTGSLMLRPEVIEGTWKKEFIWKIDAVWCAPSDFPTWCDWVEPWNYKIQAQVYDTSNFSILGWPDQSDKELLFEKNIEITIKGEVNLTPLSKTLDASAIQFVKEKFWLYAYAGTKLERYFNEFWEIYSQGDVYCKDYTLVLPFIWDIKICAPLFSNSWEIIEEDISYIEWIFSYENALEQAYTLANKNYLSRVSFDHQPSMEEAWYSSDLWDFQTWSEENPDATTYLSSWVKNWAFQDSAWIFIVSQIKAWGWSKRTDVFSDQVLVKVWPWNTSCIVKIADYKATLWVDIFTDKISCP